MFDLLGKGLPLIKIRMKEPIRGVVCIYPVDEP